MPSMMIHLLTARKVYKDATSLFWIGNVAPDAVNTREEKDITHFRTAENREEELYKLANKTVLNHSFEEGVLLHLYLDWWWDRQVFNRFTETYTGDDWFQTYRHEIAVASSWLFHNTDWSKPVWDSILNCSSEKYGNTPGVKADDLTAFLNRNYKWHSENNIGSSDIYTPDFIDEFTDMVSSEYSIFIKNVKSNMGA